MDDVISVRQLPVIEARLSQLKEHVLQVTRDAESLACTEDTVRAVKATRADLNRQFRDLEELRKTVKAQVMAPYNAFEALYKDCVTEPYKQADAKLKAEIDEVESTIKGRKEQELRTWLAEYTQARNVPWLQWDQTGIRIGLSTSLSTARKQLTDVVDRACRDVDAIRAMPDAAEVLAEYQTSLSLADAVRTVADRRERVRQAQEITAPPQTEPPKQEPEMIPAEPEVTVRLALTGTKQQLARVREYMKAIGVRYTKV